MNSAADLRLDSPQIGVAALRLAGAVRCHVVVYPRRGWDPRGRALDHARAHVRGCGADAAAQAAQVQVAGSQIRSQIAAAVVRGVEQPATEKEKEKNENDGPQ